MNSIAENVNLKSYNTFGIHANARYLAGFTAVAELEEILAEARQRNIAQHMVLGSGSNVLFTQDFKGLILHNQIPGIEVLQEDDDIVLLKAGAGLPWHELVMFAVGKGWGGLENLSLIPGFVGAGPMQNIGAYGVELKDVFYSLEAYHLQDGAMQIFNAKDCAFGYRESVFKKALKNQFAITSVTFRLAKTPVLNTSYGAIAQQLEEMKIVHPGVADVSQAVIHIRQSKLPDPKQIGNAGSFFKNPEVSVQQFKQIKKAFPQAVGYTLPHGSVKLAAGWMIEQCGWKGYRKGDAGCHARQALVLVNYGNANGSEILSLSEEIIQSVQLKFGVSLEREVNLL